MSIAPCHACSRRASDGKSGRPSSSSITFTTGTGLAPARARRQPGERRGAQRVGVRHHRRARQLVAALEHDARRACPYFDEHALHRRAGDARARRPPPRRARSAAGDRAHARRARSPTRPGDAGGQAELVVEADEGRARVGGAGERADQPLEGERHAHLLGRDARPARRRSARRGSPGPMASSQRSRSAGSSSSGRGRARPPRPSARPRRRSRRRRRATSRARAAPRCARRSDQVTTWRPSGKGANR